MITHTQTFRTSPVLAQDQNVRHYESQRSYMAHPPRRLGPDVEAIILSFCGARETAVISTGCREAFGTAFRRRDVFIWIYTNSWLSFQHAVDLAILLALQEEARQERRAYAEWYQELRNEGYGPDSD